MRPPPIRYPLPTLVALLALAVVAWKGSHWVLLAMARLAPMSTIAGTAYPSSTKPIALVGPLPLRVLLLGTSIPVSETPGGPMLEPIRHTMFAKVFDTWPRKGTTTHLRVGNKSAIGWVDVSLTLNWPTRLVVRIEKVEGVPSGVYPVLSWREGRVVLAIWMPRREWAEVDRYATLDLADLAPDAWQVWCSEDELQSALGATVAPHAAQKPGSIRLAALFGRLGESTEWDAPDFKAVRGFLPTQLAMFPVPHLADAAERLAEINRAWSPDATWSGVEYRAVPVADFP
ncbi:hypothetical protein EP7_003816 [Isosphaeraceae bacterium EP7]